MDFPEMVMKQEYKRLLLLLTLVFSPLLAQGEAVVSENMVFLKEDGKSYLLQRSMRTSHDKYNFHLEKDKGPAALYYIDPNEHEWDVSQPDANILKFSSGTFTVMYPGNYGELVTIDDNRVYTLNTWDGTTLEDGHYGSWNKPDNFSRFVQAWVIPETFRILSYDSNRKGEWIERNNTLTFFASDVNDVIFTVRYELIDADGDGVADSNDRCVDTPAGVGVDVSGCAVDSDQDGVPDRQDRCADTPQGVPVGEHGCELDSDADGVVDRLDRCPGTVEGAPVDHSGCELDCDGDGVANSKDDCPRTPAGAQVDELGCELDADSDGVNDSKDACPGTPVGARVDELGCELDTDGDGVVGSLDHCPGTPAGARVDELGCELDTDGDGVADSQDQCPGTPPGVVVDALGCELDTDGDGVANSHDRCPGTPSGVAVDEMGCDLDIDGDGVLNTADLCQNTAPGVAVDITGCERAQPIRLRGVNFHHDTADLTDEAMSILDGVARTLLSHPEIRLEVAGHTDSSGDDVYNLDLSQRRSEAVRDYLVSKGVNAAMFTAHGYGEERPVESNATAAGRAENRRVELIRQGQ
jgi:outer membrane protein OmpA-like peptidoglycan-associated protein